MSDRQTSRLDLAAVALLLAGLLVALCVFSYDPADPPGTSVYPPRERPSNLLGIPVMYYFLLAYTYLSSVSSRIATP